MNKRLFAALLLVIQENLKYSRNLGKSTCSNMEKIRFNLRSSEWVKTTTEYIKFIKDFEMENKSRLLNPGDEK